MGIRWENTAALGTELILGTVTFVPGLVCCSLALFLFSLFSHKERNYSETNKEHETLLVFDDGGPLRINMGLKNVWLGRGSNTDQTAHEPLRAEMLSTVLLALSRRPIYLPLTAWKQTYRYRLFFLSGSTCCSLLLLAYNHQGVVQQEINFPSCHDTTLAYVLWFMDIDAFLDNGDCIENQAMTAILMKLK